MSAMFDDNLLAPALTPWAGLCRNCSSVGQCWQDTAWTSKSDVEFIEETGNVECWAFDVDSAGGGGGGGVSCCLCDNFRTGPLCLEIVDAAALWQGVMTFITAALFTGTAAYAAQTLYSAPRQLVATRAGTCLQLGLVQSVIWALGMCVNTALRISTDQQPLFMYISGRQPGFMMVSGIVFYVSLAWLFDDITKSVASGGPPAPATISGPKRALALVAGMLISTLTNYCPGTVKAALYLLCVVVIGAKWIKAAFRLGEAFDQIGSARRGTITIKDDSLTTQRKRTRSLIRITGIAMGLAVLGKLPDAVRPVNSFASPRHAVIINMLGDWLFFFSFAIDSLLVHMYLASSIRLRTAAAKRRSKQLASLPLNASSTEARAPDKANKLPGKGSKLASVVPACHSDIEQEE